MKFIRLNKGAVRCILSSEDMKEYGLEIKDFMEQNEQATEFMHTLIERAAEEIGYVAKNGMITLKVMQMPDDRISITISEPGVEDLLTGEFSDKMDSLFKKLAEMERNKQEALNETVPDHPEEVVIERAFKKKEILFFAFPNLDAVSEFAKSISYGRPINSDLYKMKDSYILVMHKGAMAEASYSRICFSAFDFDALILDDLASAYLLEHGEILIKKKALSVMKKI